MGNGGFFYLKNGSYEKIPFSNNPGGVISNDIRDTLDIIDTPKYFDLNHKNTDPFVLYGSSYYVGWVDSRYTQNFPDDGGLKYKYWTSTHWSQMETWPPANRINSGSPWLYNLTSNAIGRNLYYIDSSYNKVLSVEGEVNYEGKYRYFSPTYYDWGDPDYDNYGDYCTPKDMYTDIKVGTLNDPYIIYDIIVKNETGNEFYYYWDAFETRESALNFLASSSSDTFTYGGKKKLESYAASRLHFENSEVRDFSVWYPDYIAIKSSKVKLLFKVTIEQVDVKNFKDGSGQIITRASDPGGPSIPALKRVGVLRIESIPENT